MAEVLSDYYIQDSLKSPNRRLPRKQGLKNLLDTLAHLDMRNCIFFLKKNIYIVELF